MFILSPDRALLVILLIEPQYKGATIIIHAFHLSKISIHRKRLIDMRTIIIFFAMVLSLCLLPYSTHAQMEFDTLTVGSDTLNYRLDEIVVSGTRVGRKIIDIPYPVARLDFQQYKYDRKTSISDILPSIPGVFMQSRYGNHDVRISIRGFGSRSNSGIRGVRILLDGIPESEPDGQTRIEAIDFNSVGRIEVVKGNASSLYTNAPGGVVNFINDIDFLSSSVTKFGEFGSNGLRRNGFKAAFRTPTSGFLLAYTNHTAKGFRDHSEDFWHILNTVYETQAGENTNIQLLGYFVDGLIRLPGSLTKKEYDANPFQAAKREVDFDFRRISTKGRLGIRYETYFDAARNNGLEVTTYGTIKYFERTARDYRIINRYGIGGSGRYVNKATLGDMPNEFSVGGDLFYQTGPIETYNNIGGKKDDRLKELTDETIANTGFYIQNAFDFWPRRASLLLTGRYDKVVFDQKNRLLESQNDIRRFEAFTPKAALNYKLTPMISAYTSYGLSFDSPAGNELDNYPLSTDPGKMMNPDLLPQKSKNFEIGVKGNIRRSDLFLNDIVFEATVFHIIIDDEIVPFEVYSSSYFRNSARTKRTGLELGGEVQIFNGLRLKTAYTFSNFKYASYVARTMNVDTSGTLSISDKLFSGNIVPSVPKHNLFAALSYERHLTEALVGFVRMQYQHVSGLYVDDANSALTNGHNTLGASTGIDVTFQRINLLVSGGVSNMFDNRYIGFVNINSTTGRFYEAGEPRSYFGSLKLGYAL